MKGLTRARIFAVSALFACIVFTVGYIFSNSLENAAQSSEKSQNVTQVIQEIVDPEQKIPTQTFEKYIRKTAHFSEFGLLGVECGLLIIALRKKHLVSAATAALFCVLTAMTDESLQMITDRSCEVTDVWIDFSGAVVGLTGILVIGFIITKLKNKFGGKNKNGYADDLSP